MTELSGFKERLHSLISNNSAFEEFLKKSKYGKPSAVAFADFIGTSRQSLGYYLNGERIPDALMVKQICDRCNVSSDWLLGLSEVKKPDASERAVSEYTGLSPDALQSLKKINIRVLNCILSDADTTHEFGELLNQIREAYEEDMLREILGDPVAADLMASSVDYHKFLAQRSVERIADSIMTIDNPWGVS